MKIIKPYIKMISIPVPSVVAKTIETAGRVCYKSEEKMTDDSSRKFCKQMLKTGHHSVLEHSSATVKFVVDRGISHELIRHRLCAFSQESTRYCDYTKEKFGKAADAGSQQGNVTFINPFFFEKNSDSYNEWFRAMVHAEVHYFHLINVLKRNAQEARSVLPNSLKTEVVVTANFREWMHIFKLRCDKASHPQIRQVMIPLMRYFSICYPFVFERIDCKFQGQHLAKIKL